MSGQHTPGPWFTFANGQCVGGPVGPIGNPSGADTAGIAHCGMGLRTGTEVQANASLIAAAPCLLAEGKALRAFLQAMADSMGLDTEDTSVNFSADGKLLVSVSMAEVFARWDAAIAKVTGSAA